VRMREARTWSERNFTSRTWEFPRRRFFGLRLNRLILKGFMISNFPCRGARPGQPSAGIAPENQCPSRLRLGQQTQFGHSGQGIDFKQL